MSPLAVNDTYVLGEVALVRGTFRTLETDTLVDPDLVTLTYTDPLGVVALADSDPGSGNPALENPSVGVYEFRIPLELLDTWQWDFLGDAISPLAAARRGGSINVVRP